MWGSCTWKGTSDLMSDLEVVSFRPSPDQYAWTFGGAAPVMRIRTPAVLEVYTEDCFAGRVRSEQDLVSQVCEFPFLNPQTGPFYIEGAFRIAQHDMVTWVASLCGLDPLDAYQLVTQAVESPLANVCDTNYTSIAKMAKRYLGAGAAMDGAHARLRDLAGEYRG